MTGGYFTHDTMKVSTLINLTLQFDIGSIVPYQILMVAASFHIKSNLVCLQMYWKSKLHVVQLHYAVLIA